MERKKEERDNKIFNGVLIGLFVIGILLTIVAVVQGFIDIGKQIDDANKVTTETVHLKSINYSSVVDGSFFLGCGSIGTDSYYVCYEILEDGGVTLIKLDANKTIIYEKLAEDETAYAEISQNGWGEIKGIKLYLPQNTIQVDYDLALGD